MLWRKTNCRERIIKAWGIEYDDILPDFLEALKKDLNRTTLEGLVTIAEYYSLV